MARRHLRQPQRGAALLIFLILVVTAALTYVVNSLTPEAVEAKRARQTQTVLTQAREALIGYALKYRDAQIAKDLDSNGADDQAVYGYLPLPDLGGARNQNLDPTCLDTGGNPLEGCDANNFTGITFDANDIGPTVIGRLPWRTLGIGPLRDGHGECLWLIVSSLHSRIQGTNPTLPPMNWDTLGQLDIVTANGTGALASALASAHDRPVAIIFAPGPPLPGQDRSVSTTDASDVSQCGGNYNAANYLAPTPATALGGVTNYLSGTHGASGSTGDSDTSNDPDTPKSLLTQGKIFTSDGNYLPNTCQSNDCTLVANDSGLSITSDLLFGAIRKSTNFRTDINAMLDRMVGCLRDKIAAGSSFVPKAITGFASPTDKSAGRVPDDSCYDDAQHPLGYYSHYNELFFVAKPTSGNFTVSEDGIAQSCPGVLIFASQRNDTAGSQQYRSSASERNLPANYLETPNFDNFTGVGTSFSGASQLARVSSTHTKHQDIVRCIPGSASLNQVTSSALAALGGQIVDYDPGSRTLTLGRVFWIADDDRSDATGKFFGCSWTPETHDWGSGFRSYFTFRIVNQGHGFTFAVIDGNNSTSVCGAESEQLGYSGNNNSTPPIDYPKIALEIDTSKQEDSYADGERADPDYDGGHVAFVYWGMDTVDDDDNVHGLPTPPDPSSRPAPRNPPPEDVTTTGSGIARLSTSSVPTYINIHVRIEVTRISRDNTQHSAAYQVNAWIERGDSKTNVIAAMKNTTRPFSTLYANADSAVDIHIYDDPTIYDIQGGACAADSPCPSSDQICGSDNLCYTKNFNTARLGFTTAQSSTSSSKDQVINISNFVTTWVP